MMPMVTSEVFTFRARAEGLPKKDIFGKSDPYLVFRIPLQVTGENRMSGGEAPARSLQIGGTAAVLVAGVSIAAAAVLATPVAIAVAPVAIGAAAFCAVKYANKLHSSKTGYHEVFVSEVIKCSLNPTWAEFQLAFHGSYLDSELLVECWDWDRGKPSDFMGSCEIPVNALLDSVEEIGVDFKDKKGRSAGTLYISARPFCE